MNPAQTLPHKKKSDKKETPKKVKAPNFLNKSVRHERRANPMTRQARTIKKFCIEVGSGYFD